MKKVYFNGDVVTVDDAKKTAEAVLVENGKISKVGTKEEVWQFVDEATEQVDLQGKTVMPSFIDPHSHFNLVCQFAPMVDVSAPPVADVTSVRKMVEKLKAAVGDDNKTLIMGYGYDTDLLEEKRHPNKLDLDQVSTEIPVIVAHASLHVFAVNSVALKLFGYNEESPEIEGGLIERFEGTNEPTGYLEERAFMIPFAKLSQSPNIETLKNNLRLGQQKYLENGIVVAQDGASMDAQYEFFKMAAESGELVMDVYAYPTILDRNRFVDKKVPEKIGDWMGNTKLAGVKLVLDGSPQARTACMSKPYCVRNEEDDPEYSGYLTFPEDQKVTNAIVEAIENDYQFLTHCNGDGALDQFLRCYKKALEVAQPKRDLRPVIIHCQTARVDQLDELKKLGITPSFFASHVYYWGDVHHQNFGEERASKISNQKYALEIDLLFTDHEDSPVIPPKALFSIWCCVNRKTRSGYTLGEGISAYDALKAHTINAAYTYYEENTMGSITEGKRANFVITDRNLLKVSPDEIKDIKVLETIKEGKTLYLAK